MLCALLSARCVGQLTVLAAAVLPLRVAGAAAGGGGGGATPPCWMWRSPSRPVTCPCSL